jgi:hypothetical protein
VQLHIEFVGVVTHVEGSVMRLQPTYVRQFGMIASLPDYWVRTQQPAASASASGSAGSSPADRYTVVPVKFDAAAPNPWKIGAECVSPKLEGSGQVTRIIGPICLFLRWTTPQRAVIEHAAHHSDLKAYKPVAKK